MIYSDKVWVNNYGSVVFCFLYCDDSLMRYCKFCLYMNVVVIDDICFLCNFLEIRFVCYCREIGIEMVIYSDRNVS